MMIGLPSSTEESEEKTADFIIESGAQGARIYPTVVFYETELCEMAMCGKYIPLSLDDAVIRSARVMRKFIDAGVKVIRVGLCASDNLLSDKTYYAGPNHPALGELVENRIFYDIIRDELIKKQYKHKVKIFVPKGSLSKAVGQKKANKIKLENEFFDLGITFSESTELSGYSISVIEERL
jgi:histone acetyltransferase (RNA polymerase elongator complex component)